jgi:hypothetical protein
MFRYLYGILLIALLAMPVLSYCQDSLSVKHKKKITPLLVYMDDDFFHFAGKGTDQYYTGGWQVDFLYTRNRPIHFLDRILLKAGPSANNIYSYGLFRRFYTPSDIGKSQILYGDRPYASVLTFQHKLVSVNADTKERLSSEWGLGAMGPITGGKPYQTYFHELIGAQKPMGWDNQIKNNFIVDFRMTYEKLLLEPSNHLRFLVVADAEAGTLVDNMGLGCMLRIGIMNSGQENYILPLKHNRESYHNKTQLYLYMRPVVRAVMYNATLEGGFFSNFDPYVIQPGDINNVYLQFDEGVVFTMGRLGVELIQKLRTPEFKNAKSQQVGNITFYYSLK